MSTRLGVPVDPSLETAHLQLLPNSYKIYPGCAKTTYKTGCREISMNVEELDHHSGKCIYRLVFCPKMQCQRINGKVLLFNDVIDHLGIFHKHEIIDYQLVIGKALVTEKSTPTSGVKNCIWNPSKITTSCGAIYFTFA